MQEQRKDKIFKLVINYLKGSKKEEQRFIRELKNSISKSAYSLKKL
jgi:hypothetical protein